MDTAWTWDLSSYCAKYSFLTEPRGVTMREVERIFQLDPEPPIWGNLNDYILEAVQRHNLRWFSFFLHCYENRLNGRVRCFLLREGLDLPEVSLVAILDADKEGFLRSETSLIQTIGRAARNAGGRVILYADSVTNAMDAALQETERRRNIQRAYNEAHGIVPKTIVKSVRDLIEISKSTAEVRRKDGVKMTQVEREREIAKLEKEMRQAARMMEFEYAAVLRDQIIQLRGAK